MESINIVTKSEAETRLVGEALARQIGEGSFPRRKPRQAVVIGLEGELGGGKTTFAQGIAQGLKVKEPVTSPTFVLMKRYDSQLYRLQLYHLDCYRLKGADDLAGLDMAEVFRSPRNIVLVEWAERIKKDLPFRSLWIKFKHQDQTTRELILSLP